MSKVSQEELEGMEEMVYQGNLTWTKSQLIQPMAMKSMIGAHKLITLNQVLKSIVIFVLVSKVKSIGIMFWM